MIGTAPDAKIYAIKVVGSREGGAPESRLVAAMDRVLTLRRNFSAGMRLAVAGLAWALTCRLADMVISSLLSGVG